MPRAIGLARLIEESVDRWDVETFESHINLLTALSSQVRFYDLQLPRNNPASLPQVVEMLELEISRPFPLP